MVNDNDVQSNKLQESDFHVCSDTKSKPLDLPPHIRADFDKLLHENHDLFAKSDLDLGQTPLIEAPIDTGDSTPIKQGRIDCPLHSGLCWTSI